MTPRIIKNGLVDIYTESFGDLKNEKVILIMGATAQGVMWPEEFCKALAEKGFCVIRHDHRDTGKSSRLDYEKHPYSLSDLASDVMSIIHDYSENVPVHLVGASMGSFVAQSICITHPHLVKSLTCIMSSPNHKVFMDGFVGNDTSHHPLPPSHPKILQFYQEILSISPKDVDEDLAIHKEIWKEISGDTDHHNLEVRIFEGKILKRLKNNKYIHNHSYALASSDDLFDKLKNISQPTLVIHGTDDYVLPLEHGKMLADLIPNSKFVQYEHMGHCLPLKTALTMVSDLVAHFKAV